MQIQLIGSGGASFTIRVQGSLQNPLLGPPDFSAAPSLTNPWDYLASFDYQDPTSIIKGDDGIAFGMDDVINLLVNVDGMVWLDLEISSFSSGAFTAVAVVYNNQ